MEWHTTTKEQIEQLVRLTTDVSRITNALCCTNKELRRLLTEYWPELARPKRNVEGLRELFASKQLFHFPDSCFCGRRASRACRG